MSINGERQPHNDKDAFNPAAARPARLDWGKQLGLPEPDIAELSQLGLEILYDDEMNRTLAEIDRVVKFWPLEGSLASFSLLKMDLTERITVIRDLTLAGPETLTVIRNRRVHEEKDQIMGASMWILSAHKGTVEYHYNEVHRTKKGWARPTSSPLIQPHGDLMAIVVPGPKLGTPLESMPMDDDGESKTQGQVNALIDLVQTLQSCDGVSLDEQVIDYHYTNSYLG